MAAPLIGAGVGGLMGMVNANQKKGEYNRQKQLAADIERNSAWTGVHGQMPQNAPNTFDSVLQGATSGAMMGSPGGLFGGAAGAPASAPSAPMAGAQQAGGSGLTQNSMNQMAGGFSQSPWEMMKKTPSMFG